MPKALHRTSFLLFGLLTACGACQADDTHHGHEEHDGASRDSAADASNGDLDAHAPNGPQPEMIYSTLTRSLAHVHVDERFIWWEWGNEIYQAPKDGTGQPREIGERQGGAGQRFRDDATHIYWLSREVLKRAPKDGGEVETIPLGRNFAFGAWDMDEDFFYLTNAYAAAVWRLPRGGGELEELAELNTEGDKGGGVRMNLIADSLYVAYLSDVWTVDPASIQTRHVADELWNASEAVAAENSVYFADGRSKDGLHLFRYEAGSGLDEVASTDIQNRPQIMLFDPQRETLIWITNVPIGRLMAYSIESKQFSFYSPEIWSSGIPVEDEEYVYWARDHSESPGIMRMRKP